MIYFILILVIAIIGFGVKIFILEGKKRDLATYIEELKKIFNTPGIQSQKSSTNTLNNNSTELHKEDFGQKEIKSKKLYQLFQELLDGLKGGDTHAVAIKIKEHVTEHKALIGSNQIMISQELITMILHFKKNPQDKKVTPENIKIIMNTLKETIISETNFTTDTFEKVKIK